MAGRKPLPTETKKLRGNPGKRALNQNEPKPQSGVPEMPEGLTRLAQQEWERIVAILAPTGILSIADGAALAGYCQNWARWMQAEQDIELRGQVVEHTVIKGKGDNAVTCIELKKNPSVTVSEGAQKLMGKFLSEFGLSPSSRARLSVGSSADEQDPVAQWLAKQQAANGAAPEPIASC